MCLYLVLYPPIQWFVRILEWLDIFGYAWWLMASTRIYPQSFPLICVWLAGQWAWHFESWVLDIFDQTPLTLLKNRGLFVYVLLTNLAVFVWLMFWMRECIHVSDCVCIYACKCMEMCVCVCACIFVDLFFSPASIHWSMYWSAIVWFLYNGRSICIYVAFMDLYGLLPVRGSSKLLENDDSPMIPPCRWRAMPSTCTTWSSGLYTFLLLQYHTVVCNSWRFGSTRSFFAWLHGQMQIIQHDS